VHDCAITSTEPQPSPGNGYCLAFEYVENHSHAELLDQVLDEELPRYAEALERLGQ
jgi:hypothetical protein